MMETKIVILTEEAYQALDDKLNTLIQLIGQVKSAQQEIWLTNKDVMNLLHVSKSTLQSYRDKGIITFSQIGRKILYKESEIHKAVEKYNVPSFKTLKAKNK